MGKQKPAKSFGPTIRAWREEKKIGLRRFADQVGMSPTYLSKVERGDFPPPGEEKIVAIAVALEKDADELLALAGRVASDLSEIIQRTPREMATFLRAAKGLTPKDLEQFTRQAEKKKRPEK
jgi:transcriptional regulator with XRE-family HTH domain